MTPVTEPLRAEHRELLPHLAELDQTPSGLRAWSSEEAHDRLGAIVAFLRHHLIPHAIAEDEVLYPAVEEVMGAPGATATMQADHTEVVARVDRLAATVDAVTERWPDLDLVDDVAVQLAGLSAIIGLHFRKEEEVLLPRLDRSLSPTAAEELFSRMGHAAHDH
jgi:iron-sulfur cluster repair protein YtfE (RIC family)